MNATKHILISTFAISLACAPALATTKHDPVSNALIESAITARYAANPHLRAFGLQVDVHEGSAHVTGTVDTETKRQLALRLARDVDGVHTVTDGVVVAGDGDSESTSGLADAAITAKVKSRLMWNSGTDGLDIDVTTSNGQVTLAGTVDEPAEVDLAHDIALHTDGVRGVDVARLRVARSNLDELEAKADETARRVGEEVSDASITAAVTKTIMLDKRFFTTRLDVHTDGGIVSLEGEVDSARQRDELIASVRTVAGVRGVDADLVVR